ncbi:DNA-directed RNA polymerase I subunit RPA43 [Fundulus heteroclitus]|uniref:DNA-directed RNA polymerase I subunit RPA43 n=1 Tax=Fundulus heteroclitus TaxID=8078 RepID=UPI00165C301A|nr:DNA-directed RNA polymerase I subunit RPA43 [Fundulus heteroclitus]
MANLKHAEEDQNHVKMPGEAPAAGSPVKPDQESRVPGGSAGAIPSFAAASELLSAPYSCLVLNTHRRHIALPPVYLSKKRTGIQEELDAELLKFSQSLHGVPLAYDNIRIATQHGDIYDDSGYIHMDIEADFIVFQAKKGQKLLGKVNKLGVSHVGCLVHGCFNASIPKPNLVSVETWRDAGPRIGAELEFKVMALDADAAGVLLIRGQLDRTRVQELMAMSENSEPSIPAGQQEPQEAQPVPEPAEQCHDGTPKKKKKKKDKERIKEEETEEEIRIPPPVLNGSTGETNSGVTPEKKKKKKKEKHVKEEQDQTEVSAMEDQSCFSDKPSKKRKLDSWTDAPSGDDPTPKKSKKKRKTDI